MSKDKEKIVTTDQKYRDLLRDYVDISSRRSGAAAALALRSESVSYRDIMAYQATGGKLTYGELRSNIEAKIDLKPNVEDAHILAELGRVALLQNMLPEDSIAGETLLTTAIELLPSGYKSRVFRRLLVQHDLLTGNYRRAEHLLEIYPDVDRDSYHHLKTDLMNPFLNTNNGNSEEWLAAFNAPFHKHDLFPVRLSYEDSLPFDRLTTDITNLDGAPYYQDGNENRAAMADVDSDELVSVVMTSYRPIREHILNSVKSLLNQTWSKIEIIVVDDSSGVEYERIFDEVAELDKRIRIARTQQNSGTYQARNLGFNLANGVYITGQDDDDWSHPQRISTQVSYLRKYKDVAACRVHSIASTEYLSMARLGKRTPEETNASTMMMSRKTWEKVGGFLPIRKAADTELYLRIERVTRKKTADIDVPLTIIRKLEGSLSHDEFRTGWSHPARRHFKSSYNYWHRTTSSEQLQAKEALFNVSVPRKFQQSEVADRQFDVIFAGDWHPFGGPQRSMLEEIKALLSAGKRIGILHFDPARFMRVRERELCDQILELINLGKVTNVLYDDPVSTRLLILRYPPIMQFAPAKRSNIISQRTIILANQAPEESDGRDIRYIPSMVQDNTEFAFQSPVTWAPQSFMVRNELEPRLDTSLIEDFDLPGILDLDEWFVRRRRPRSTLPVVGRHSRDNSMKWPEKQSHLRAAYPTDGTFDVRILGGTKAPLRVLRKTHVPGSWTAYETNQLSPEKFLATIDFYVFFQHSKTVEAFGRAILEALASGLVVILPDKFEPVFGKAAIYATPEEVISVVRNLHQDWPRYQAQVATSMNHLQENFSYASYTRRIEGLLKENYETLV